MSFFISRNGRKGGVKMRTVEFTKEMKQTHTILIPMMLPIHFRFLEKIMQEEGYHVELLQSDGKEIIDEGLKNVHNDTCYPALLVIGQMIHALKSGNYDMDHVALAITQTGGGCRASNYIHLLRKALEQAGFSQVPVISVNFSNLEKNSGFQMTPKMLLKLAVSFIYADTLMWLYNQCVPYEYEKGTSSKLVDQWVDKILQQLHSLAFLKLKHNYIQMVQDFNAIEKHTQNKTRVGIVGEIYMKYAPLGNNHLEEFLISENCEPVVSGVLNFGLYCLENVLVDYKYYGKHQISRWIAKWGSNKIQKYQKIAIEVIEEDGNFYPPETFEQLKQARRGLIDQGCKMGEGWLLTAEMAELLKSGVSNIVCCQPFGCLPNHIVAKGMMHKIKRNYPQANIVAVDYDPGATKVNQENRLKLMLANAQK